MHVIPLAWPPSLTPCPASLAIFSAHQSLRRTTPLPHAYTFLPRTTQPPHLHVPSLTLSLACPFSFSPLPSPFNVYLDVESKKKEKKRQRLAFKRRKKQVRGGGGKKTPAKALQKISYNQEGHCLAPLEITKDHPHQEPRVKATHKTKQKKLTGTKRLQIKPHQSWTRSLEKPPKNSKKKGEKKRKRALGTPNHLSLTQNKENNYRDCLNPLSCSPTTPRHLAPHQHGPSSPWHLAHVQPPASLNLALRPAIPAAIQLIHSTSLVYCMKPMRTPYLTTASFLHLLTGLPRLRPHTQLLLAINDPVWAARPTLKRPSPNSFQATRLWITLCSFVSHHHCQTPWRSMCMLLHHYTPEVLHFKSPSTPCNSLLSHA